MDERELYLEVGRRIRMARLKQVGLTQAKLADRVKLTRSSITNIERGKQKLLIHTLCEIAEAIGVEPASLLPSSTAPTDIVKVLEGVRKPLTQRQRENLLVAVGQLQTEVHRGSTP